jgi:UDP-galactopyranose mutase
MTLTQLWGIITPEAAVDKLAKLSQPVDQPKNLEEWILSQVGEELYELFVKGYTQKQWGREPKFLPASIIRRIPIRTNFNDFYFDDLYQGIPEGGYTALIQNLLNGIEVRLEVDYIKNKIELNQLANHIVFTGAIDEYFDYEYGILEYRSIEFIHKHLEIPDFQGTSVINYTDRATLFTRILEHKHFEFGRQLNTIISEEYSVEWRKGLEPYYPINDDRNSKMYSEYRNKAALLYPNVIFGGRLAEYKYYDMHQVVGSALSSVKRVLVEK